jgi:hypothetical protein
VSTPANVTDVRVDDEGIAAHTDDEVVLDVLFDGRRIWSFWLIRDSRLRSGRYFVPWPPMLRRFLNGYTKLTLAEHVGQRVVFDEEVHLGRGEDRIAVVNERGLPLGIDKSLRLAQTFDTRSKEHVAPLLDAFEEVLGALKKAGVDAFPAYGTLLGAVSGGELIGHDSDADLGYVSHHEYPVDVMLESFRLQRALAEMGYRITRYSGAAFKVAVVEADGSARGLDVFGGFISGGHLHLMGEIRTPFRPEWVYPLGTCTLEGRELPAPADPDRFLTATYGPSWRVPDPAFHFETPPSTYRRLNGWFRGTRVKRAEWDRTYSGPRLQPPSLEPSTFARWVLGREGHAPEQLVDVGSGYGVDALWFARQGTRATGLDFVPRASSAVAKLAAEEGVDLTFRRFNLNELRSVLAESARIAHQAGPRVVTGRHIADATDRAGRAHLWRACEMMLAGGGRLYLQFLVRRGPHSGFARKSHLRGLPVDLVVSELEARGATVLSREVVQEKSDPPPGGAEGTARARRVGRLVVEWQR